MADHVLRWDEGEHHWTCATGCPPRDPGCPLPMLYDLYSILNNATRSGIDEHPSWPESAQQTYENVGNFLYPEGHDPADDPGCDCGGFMDGHWSDCSTFLFPD